MSSIDSSTASPPLQTLSDTSAAAVNGYTSLKPEDFIRLFLTQMKDQNPLKPMDNAAILQQMTSLSAIQANHDMQKTLTDFSQNMSYTMGKSQVFAASQLIGKKVEVPSPQCVLTPGEGLNGSVRLNGAATGITVTVKDLDGKTVCTKDCGATQTGGLVDFSWDGKGPAPDNKEYPAGLYNVSATATVNGQSVGVPVAGSFKVNSVAMDRTSGEVILNVDQVGGIGMNDVIKIL